MGGSYYNCDIVGNIGGDGGGLRGIALAQDCLIQGNSARYGAGTVWCGPLVRCRIFRNSSQNDSAAVDGNGYGSGTTYITNCLVAYNFGGAGIKSTIAVNCTIVSNSNGGVVNGSTQCALTNCIVYGNLPSDFKAGTYYVGYTCAKTNVGTFPGAIGIITNYPMFVDPTTNDYRIVRTSPCFNTGINQDWMFNSVDMDGNPRICNFNVDMGAYEYSRPQGTIFTILGAPMP